MLGVDVCLCSLKSFQIKYGEEIMEVIAQVYEEYRLGRINACDTVIRLA